MHETIIAGYKFQVTTDGTYDWASSGGKYYYYTHTGTENWVAYTKPAQSSSSSTVPAQYSNRLPANVYDGTIGRVQIRWGPAARKRLQEEAPAKGVSVQTIKALTEHFTYRMAARIGASKATIKSPPKDFSVDSAVNRTSSDYEHITAELSGKKKAHVYINGKGSGATAYDNVSTSGESIMTKGKDGYAIDTNLSTGNYSLAGAFASQVVAAAASSSTTATASSSTSQDPSKWHDDPQRPGIQRRWSASKNKWESRKKQT